MRLVAVIACVTLGACANPNENAAEIRSLQIQLAALEASAEINHQAIADLRALIHANSPTNEPAVVSVKGGYDAARTKLGVLLISWDDIAPLGNGSRVTLKIGNLTSGKLNGLHLYGSWMGDPGGTIDEKIPDDIWPGKWNRVTFQISGAKPEAVNLLSIGIGTDVVGLN